MLKHMARGLLGLPASAHLLLYGYLTEVFLALAFQGLAVASTLSPNPYDCSPFRNGQHPSKDGMYAK